jgi:F-type H+-transporting ATPase subunit b
MMLPLLFAPAEGGLPDPFSPTFGLFFWTIVVFIPFLWVLSKFVFPIIVKATADREAAITKQLADAEKARADAAGYLEEQRAMLAAARGEAHGIVAEAREAGDRERMAALDRTRAEQDELLARAKREIQGERERAISEIRREAVDLAIAAAGKVVGQHLDGASDRKLVEEYITTLRTGA